MGEGRTFGGKMGIRRKKGIGSDDKRGKRIYEENDKEGKLAGRENGKWEG